MADGQSSVAPIIIREAGEDDAQDIVSLLYEAFVEYRSLYTVGGFAATAISQSEVVDRMREGPMFVATRNGSVVGSVAILLKDESLYISGMAVHPTLRGQRIGDQLLCYVEELAISLGVRRLILSTTPFLGRAIRLYQSFGFHRIDDGPHDLYGTPLFTMEKLLPPSSS